MNCVACGERHFKLGEVWSSGGQIVRLIDLYVESLCPRHMHEVAVYMHTIPERREWRELHFWLSLQAEAGTVPIGAEVKRCVQLQEKVGDAVLKKISEWAAQSAAEIAKAEEEKEAAAEKGPK